jgi:hypothetical protein
MRRTVLSAAAAFVLLASPTAIAQMAAQPAEEFVAMAASSDLFEIQSSTLALKKQRAAR